MSRAEVLDANAELRNTARRREAELRALAARLRTWLDIHGKGEPREARIARRIDQLEGAAEGIAWTLGARTPMDSWLTEMYATAGRLSA